MPQVDKMIGKGAPADFIQNLEELAKTHHADMALDNIRAYYFGQRFIVEMEVVLPSAMTVRESHDIALILQHKVWSLAVGITGANCIAKRPQTEHPSSTLHC